MHVRKWLGRAQPAAVAAMLLLGAAPFGASLAAAPERAALKAMDAIAAKDWLIQPSGTLLDRVIAASSKESLDAAAKKDPRAQALVGTAHLSGAHGYAKSDEGAARFYRLAAEVNPIAQNNLASMLVSGTANGGKPAPEQAVPLFEKAAKQGHPVAQYNLGVMYRDGTGVGKDWVPALMYFISAAEQGNTAARQALDQKQAEDRAAQQAVERAQQEALMAAGDADALYREAEYWAGMDDGTEEAYSAIQEEFEEALLAYLRDAKAGSAYAMRRAADMYLQGDGVRNTDTARAEAIRLYREAARKGDEVAQKKLKELGESW